MAPYPPPPYGVPRPSIGQHEPPTGQWGPPPPQWGPPPAQWGPPPGYAVAAPVQAVSVYVGQQSGPTRSVTKERKGTSHGLHLFLTIITAGMWGLFVWLPLSMWHAMGPRRRVVTRHH